MLEVTELGLSPDSYAASRFRNTPLLSAIQCRSLILHCNVMPLMFITENNRLWCLQTFRLLSVSWYVGMAGAFRLYQSDIQTCVQHSEH
jgi:hypothetical protein